MLICDCVIVSLCVASFTKKHALVVYVYQGMTNRGFAAEHRFLTALACMGQREVRGIFAGNNDDLLAPCG